MAEMGIKGKKFSIGARNSGTEGSGRTILTGLGIDTDKHYPDHAGRPIQTLPFGNPLEELA